MARACSSAPNRFGNAGRYLKVRNCASENGLSLLTRGRAWLARDVDLVRPTRLVALASDLPADQCFVHFDHADQRRGRRAGSAHRGNSM